MIKLLYKSILKFFYKLFILNIEVIYKDNTFNTFMKELFNVTINTNKGDMVFSFYADRRKSKRNSMLPFKYYLVSVKVPEGSNEILKKLEDYFILIIKFKIPFVNYKILGELLFDICVDKYLDVAEKLVKEK